MSRVLVTGAAGFTGRYMIARLAEDGHEIHALVKESGTNLPADVTACHIAALDDTDRLTAICELVRPEYVLHLAAIAFVGHKDPNQIYATNLLGTRNLLQSLVDAQVHPSAVLIASSANIYGNQREGILGEETPPDPVNDYGVSKLAMEYMSRLYSTALPIIVARPFNYTGVGQDISFLIPKIVDHLRREADVIELGNLAVERDFSDVRWVVDAYARLIASPSAIGKTLNICSGKALALQDIIDMACRAAGRSLAVRVNPEFVRRTEVRSLCGDRSRLEAVIGPSKGPPFEETLRWMLEA